MSVPLTFVGLRSTRPRKVPIRRIVLHWTGGQGDAAQLFRVLRKTIGPRTPDGLSVHYGVQSDGLLTQYAPDSLVCLHAGEVNDDSIGFEVTCPGYPGSASRAEAKRGIVRTEYVDRIRGRRIRMLDYTAAQMATVTREVERLCAHHGIPRRVPTEADGSLMRRQMTPRELAAYAGILGHYHCHDEKNDPGTAPLEALRLRWLAAT